MFLLHRVFTTTDLCIFCKLGIGITHFCQPKLKRSKLYNLAFVVVCLFPVVLGFPFFVWSYFFFCGTWGVAGEDMELF